MGAITLRVHMFQATSYGSRRLVTALANSGLQVGRYKVRRLMQQASLKPVWKRKFVHTTDSKHALPVAPNLLARQFNPAAPIWLTPRISRISALAPAGCTWLSCSTCSRAESWAGRWRRACPPPWSAMPCAWRFRRAVRLRALVQILDKGTRTCSAPAEFTQPEQLPRFRTEFAPEFPDPVGRTALCECDA